MAYPEVSEESVYLTAGAPLPARMDALLHSLLNDDFQTAYGHVLQASTHHLSPS